MDFKYSASTRGFYPSDMLDEYKNLPDDLVDVTADEHEQLFAAQTAGLQIVSDASGRPIAVSPPPYVPSQAELIADRDSLLGFATLRVAPLQDAVDIGDATAAEEAQLLAWKKYRVALSRLDLTTTPVAWPVPPA